MKQLTLLLSLVVCICAASTNNVFAQNREFQTFKGKVTNLKGEPIRSVHIGIPGFPRGTVSDPHGKFIIAAKDKETLCFSHIGMKDVFIRLDKDHTDSLLVQMEQEIRRLPNATVSKTKEINEMANEYAFELVANNPEFPGGPAALETFLKEKLQYPEEAFQAGEEGEVMVEFTIDKEGNAVNAEITKSVSPALDKEALRIIRTMPRWKPGMQRALPVPVRMSLPVNFFIYLRGPLE